MALAHTERYDYVVTAPIKSLRKIKPYEDSFKYLQLITYETDDAILADLLVMYICMHV